MENIMDKESNCFVIIIDEEGKEKGGFVCKEYSLQEYDLVGYPHIPDSIGAKYPVYVCKNIKAGILSPLTLGFVDICVVRASQVSRVVQVSNVEQGIDILKSKFPIERTGV